MVDDPKYLLTRLLIRRQGKIHPYTNLVLAYSAELGDEGVKKAMRVLSTPLPTPKDLLESEPDVIVPEAGPSRSNSFVTPAKPPASAPLSVRLRENKSRNHGHRFPPD
jgi:Fanconi-associated nuclease 1